ncbi:MAG: hypothetical protein JO294_12240 [Alphaproteobacteria bacterium]|nr:hypothetical protein [Alphaproteobacteria bacterium]MBV9903071.1 hypothetical protein [Alphaproteobacteria bacterium]
MFKTTLLATAAVLAAAVATPASAAEMIDSYSAYLSRADHYNSQGQRIMTAAGIIRQDRANYHKFGLRDPGDENDSYFDSVANRAILEKMLSEGDSDPGVLSRIVNSNVRIHVEVYRGDREGDYVVVTLGNAAEGGY